MTRATVDRRGSRSSYRPQFDVLEARCLLSTYLVDRVTDANPGGGGVGSGMAGDLRYCIMQANALVGDDTIIFGVTGTVDLAGALPNVNSNMGIQGPGAHRLTVRRNTGGAYRIFTVTSAPTVVLSGLTITNGLIVPFDDIGGGILNSGTLTVRNCTISGNRAVGDTSGAGGGLFNYGTMTVSDSTIASNSVSSFAYGSYGGGIYNTGTLTLLNTTVSGNTADGFGGGISNEVGTLNVSNSTITGNRAADFGIGDWRGGGIYSTSGSVNLRNTILAGNFASSTSAAGPDLWGSLTSSGYNLISITTGGSGFAVSDRLNVNPLLGPLRDNGGPTWTHALLAGSPALSAGDPDFARPPDTDQRGFNRSVGRIDIGAYEAQNIIDDGDIAFSTTSGFLPFTGQGYKDGVHFAAAGDDSQTATWTFTGLSAGLYRVSATWTEHSNRATNAPYSIYDGLPPDNLLQTVSVDQERAANHFIDNGRPWFNLGGVHALTGNTLVVQLTNAANEYVVADAVRIEQLTMGPLQIIVDDGDANFVATNGFVQVMDQGHGGDVSFAATGSGGVVAIWIFTVTPGVYRVSTTWTAHENRATNAPFFVFDGNNLRGFVTVNQEIAPDDFSEGDTLWEDLGNGVYTVTSGPLYVVLTNDADEYVIADAIRVERLS